jgi:hypothetical protein
MTGLKVSEFDDLIQDVMPSFAKAEMERLSRPDRQRAIGGGCDAELKPRDQTLLTVVWLRQYPTFEVLGYLFGVSDSTAWRYVQHVLPVLEQAGRNSMRMPKPGKRGRQLDDLLSDTPELAIVIDSFEQRVQRPQEREEADQYYSGKKKQHTLKSQVAVNEDTGEIIDVSPSVRGPMADIKLLETSHLLERLPQDVGAIGDLAYIGIDKLHPQGLGVAPRRKPRGKPRPEEDIAYNTAFSQRRIIVEHTIGRLRRYEALTRMDRHHRCQHEPRVVAVAGLVNHQLRSRFVF